MNQRQPAPQKRSHRMQSNSMSALPGTASSPIEMPLCAAKSSMVISTSLLLGVDARGDGVGRLATCGVFKMPEGSGSI